MLERYSAVESDRAEGSITVQLLPESMEYSQLPSANASAALAVIATALRVSESRSEKESAKRLATVSPAGYVLSSAMELRDGLALVVRIVGASLTVVIMIVELTVGELVSPSFTTQEMVRSVVLGLSDVLL